MELDLCRREMQQETDTPFNFKPTNAQPTCSGQAPQVPTVCGYLNHWLAEEVGGVHLWSSVMSRDTVLSN